MCLCTLDIDLFILTNPLTWCYCLACVVCLGPNATAFEAPQVRERELFAAFNIDTHPASLFRYGSFTIGLCMC